MQVKYVAIAFYLCIMYYLTRSVIIGLKGGNLMYSERKIGIIGLGHVGAHVANSLLIQGIADELYLCGHNDKKVLAENQDLQDSMCFVPYNTRIINCGVEYEALAKCDIIINCAGNIANSASSRDGELFDTTKSAETFANRIVSAGFDGVIVSVANPCDVVCTSIWHLTGYDTSKIIGTGCGLDSARLCSEISKVTNISPKSIEAYMIGEHGFSQIAAWESATIAGVRIIDLAKTDPERFGFDRPEIEERARKAGYVTYAGKGCTEYAVSNCAARLCAAILHNEHAVLSVSTLMTGQYGVEGVYSSLPCVIGSKGVEHVFTPQLSEEEKAGFLKSCEHTRESFLQLGLE